MKYYLLTLLLSITLFSKSKITGKITSDDDQNGLAVVNINVVGTNIKTIADFDGNYELNLTNGEYDIIFDFISYETDTIHLVVKNNTIYNHKMKSR